jgi:hypothetical protein
VIRRCLEEQGVDRVAAGAVEAQMLVGPDDKIPAALLFARRQP